ncbi:MAG: hypothetical protein EZS28_004948 [Streblomastix strix]|uniref:Uncharacterized protein n=1 Tax=Streblomastix strix TaxID=222440 RepID=A0A5J4WWV0_9EUKA|nr:MAG: hypothetical protein EZS28_004948 [Streblomastix strix]
MSNLSNFALFICEIVLVGNFSVFGFPSILTILTVYILYATSSRFLWNIISGFSGGIIQYARCSFVSIFVQFNHTIFRSYNKSYVCNYRYKAAQLRAKPGNELKIGFNRFKSGTPENVIGYGIQQLNLSAVALNAATGISISIPQWLFPAAIDSNDDTLTKFLVYKSDNEFAEITAYSLAQIDVSHSFVLSLQIANYQNGPQAAEYPCQNLIYSEVLFCYYVSPSAPAAIVSKQLNVQSAFPVKLTFYNAVAAPATAVQSDLLIYKDNLLAGIVIYQLIQQVYTIEHMPLHLAPNGAWVYLYPSFDNRVTG